MNDSRGLFRNPRVALVLAAAVWLFACDSPQFPVLCGSPPEQTIVVGETVTVDLCFDDRTGTCLPSKCSSPIPRWPPPPGPEAR